MAKCHVQGAVLLGPLWWIETPGLPLRCDICGHKLNILTFFCQYIAFSLSKSWVDLQYVMRLGDEDY